MCGLGFIHQGRQSPRPAVPRGSKMNEYEAGKQDALTGEVDFAWNDMWSDDYREGVTDGLMSLSLV